MLQDRYESVAVKGLQQLEPDGVPGRSGRVQREVDRVRQVLERVVEPGLPLVAELGVDAEQERGNEHDDEEPVSGPRPRGQRTQASQARILRPVGPGSPRRWLT